MAQKITDVSKRRPTSLFFSSLHIPSPCPFKKLIDNWLDNGRIDDLSRQTLYDYSDKLSRFWWWWNIHTKYAETIGLHPQHVTDKHLKLFAAYLREPLETRWGVPVVTGREQMSPATVASYGRTIKAFFNWLEREQHIPKSPFNKSVKFSTHKKDKVIKSVSADNLTKIFAVLTSPESLRTYAGTRDLAIVSLLLDSGMRRGELLSLEISDLDIRNLRCTIRGKTGQRYAYFSEKCKGVLLDYLKFRLEVDGEGPLWLTVDGEGLAENSFGSIIHRLEIKTGVDFHAHQLRHTFALMMSSKVSVFELMDMMGHSNISTTMIYVKNSPERIGEAHRGNSPLNTLENNIPGLKHRGRPRRFR